MGDLGSIPGLGRSLGKGKGYPLQYSGLENSLECIIHGVAKSPTQLSNFHFHFHQIYWSRKCQPTPVFLGFLCGSAGKKSTSNVGDLGLIPGLERSPGEGKDCPLQYSGLENSMDCTVHGVAKSQAQLSDFHSLTHIPLILINLITESLYLLTAFI